MSYKLPPNGQWTQKNVGDATGSLWSTFNVDLTTKQGDTKVTRLLKNKDSVDLVDLGTPIGFVKHQRSSPSTAPWLTVAGNRVFIGGSRPNSAFSLDVTSGTPTTCSSAYSDIAIFNDNVYVTTTNETVYKFDDTTWSSFTAGSADANNPHILCQYGNRMYRTRANDQIISWDTSDTVVTTGQYTLDLNTSYSAQITFMKAASDRIWIGTVNALGGSGAIYSWDGSSGNPIKYALTSTGVTSGVVKNDILYAMDNNGKLLMFNSSTFVEVAKLPNFSKKFFHNPTDEHSRWIHPNGMAVIEDRINILIDSSLEAATSTPEEMCPSGIWEYDKDIGLYHKYSPSYCTTSATVTDYGQQRISVAGGLAFAKSASTSTNYGTLLAGMTIYSNASTELSGIYFDDTGDLAIKTGYIVTTKIPSGGITDNWQRFVLKYNNLINASDKIICKYRLLDVDPIEATITWTSTTTFTTTTNLSAYWTSGTGFECEVVQGTGAGMCSHITSITGSGTYTITVDMVHTGVTSGTAIARFQKWIKIGSIEDTTSTFKIIGFPSSANSNFIQLKVFMLMYGSDELKEIDIQSVVSQPL